VAVGGTRVMEVWKAAAGLNFSKVIYIVTLLKSKTQGTDFREYVMNVSQGIRGGGQTAHAGGACGGRRRPGEAW
jgi:surface antigen